MKWPFGRKRRTDREVGKTEYAPQQGEGFRQELFHLKVRMAKLEAKVSHLELVLKMQGYLLEIYGMLFASPKGGIKQTHDYNLKARSDG